MKDKLLWDRTHHADMSYDCYLAVAGGFSANTPILHLVNGREVIAPAHSLPRWISILSHAMTWQEVEWEQCGRDVLWEIRLDDGRSIHTSPHHTFPAWMNDRCVVTSANALMGKVLRDRWGNEFHVKSSNPTTKTSLLYSFVRCDVQFFHATEDLLCGHGNL